jgi:hypothetical protein
MNWRALTLVLALSACGDGEPASIGAIHHEVAEVAQEDGRLIVTVRARSGAVDQSYWLPHVAGVARQVLVETAKRWPEQLAGGVVFRSQVATSGAPTPALDLFVDREQAMGGLWSKASDFAVLEAARVDSLAPAGGRAVRAFCDDPTQARHAPTFCQRAIAAGR